MKVLHVVSSMDPLKGGVSRAIRDIIFSTSSVDSSVESSVVCLDSSKEQFILDDPFTVYALGSSLTSWSINLSLIPWLKENIFFFDIVVIHGLWQFHSLVINQLCCRFHIPYYVMPHGMLDPYFQESSDRRYKSLRNRFIWNIVERKFVNDAKGILFTCDEERFLAEKTFQSYNPQSTCVVGLGIKSAPDKSVEFDIAFKDLLPEWNNKPTLLFLGRIHPKKGIDLLIKAYIDLEESFNDLPQLVVAGPGIESDYGKSILEMSKVCKHIFFPGMLNGDYKWGALYNCEAFILPSHQENFGIAIVEALSIGKPVLITDKVNIWREIIESNSGFVATDTQNGIYNMLLNWLKMTSKEKLSYKSNSKLTYENFFSVDKAGLAFVDAIRDKGNV